MVAVVLAVTAAARLASAQYVSELECDEVSGRWAGVYRDENGYDHGIIVEWNDSLGGYDTHETGQHGQGEWGDPGWHHTDTNTRDTDHRYNEQQHNEYDWHWEHGTIFMRGHIFEECDAQEQYPTDPSRRRSSI